MARTIKILKGNRQLQDVEKVTPDTRVNLRAKIKYPFNDLINGVTKKFFYEDELDDEELDDPYEFEDPDEYIDPDNGSAS